MPRMKQHWITKENDRCLTRYMLCRWIQRITWAKEHSSIEKTRVKMQMQHTMDARLDRREITDNKVNSLCKRHARDTRSEWRKGMDVEKDRLCMEGTRDNKPKQSETIDNDKNRLHMQHARETIPKTRKATEKKKDMMYKQDDIDQSATTTALQADDLSNCVVTLLSKFQWQKQRNTSTECRNQATQLHRDHCPHLMWLLHAFHTEVWDFKGTPVAPSQEPANSTWAWNVPWS